MSLETLSEDLDDFVPAENIVSAFADRACVGHAFEKLRSCSAFCDVHGKSKFTHPILHSLQTLHCNLLVCLVACRNVPDIDGKSSESGDCIRGLSYQQAIVGSAHGRESVPVCRVCVCCNRLSKHVDHPVCGFASVNERVGAHVAVHMMFDLAS